MFTNTTKQKLADGHTVVGCLLPLPEPTLAEMLASCGFDFILLDGEHGLFGPREIADAARAIELRGATPLARVTANKEEIVLRFLDAGAHGVQVPSLNSYDACEAAVRSTKYGPRGHRGLAGSRMSDFGTTVSIGDYTRIANEQTMVIGHVETAAAVGNIEDFLHVDGLDVIFLGPVDLSHSLGHPGDLNHPDVADAIDTVASAVLGSDKVLGVYAPTPDGARTWMERGARYILTSFDTFIVEGASRYLSHLRVEPSVET
ncbi:MAG: aldolase/citrate lyase family protein [Actinomycetia bacterium]|nr:aldolase/citrate lyase family protein [Actinomycetes bacterium]